MGKVIVQFKWKSLKSIILNETPKYHIYSLAKIRKLEWLFSYNVNWIYIHIKYIYILSRYTFTELYMTGLITQNIRIYLYTRHYHILGREETSCTYDTYNESKINRNIKFYLICYANTSRILN